MKKLWRSLALPLSLGFLAAGALLFKSLGENQAGQPPRAQEPEARLYSIQLELWQKSGNEPPFTLLQLEGTFAQSQVEANAPILTSWTSFELARLMAQDARDEVKILLAQTVSSSFHPQSGELEHLLESSSAQLQLMQASVLEKILLPQNVFAADRAAKGWEQQGRDEVGSYRARYQRREEASGIKVHKQWLRYAQAGIEVKPESQGFTYHYSKDGRLERIEGSLSLAYATLIPTVYTTNLKVALLGTRPQLASLQSPPGSAQLQKFSLSAAIRETVRPYPELLREISSIDANSSSKDVYRLFTDLKSLLKLEPGHAEALAERIRSTRARDEGAKRQMALIFGALAQSQSSETLSQLGGLLETCSDAYCRVQALVAISDHRRPDAAVVENVMNLIKESRDAELSSTALLTLGSVAKNWEDDQAPITAFLLAELESSPRGELKTSVLAAMGNHGDPRYYLALGGALESADSRIRAAAVYSLRSQPSVDADARLLQIISKESNKTVLHEAFKALAYRSLSAEAYQELVATSVSLKDEDLQLAAARALVNAAQARVPGAEAALEDFAELTQLSQVRSYLASEKAQLHPR